MGDFIREAFRTSGIDEKMEKVIAETILQRWNDEFGRKSRRSAVAPQNIDSVKNQSGTVRLITEQLWRRLERKSEEKLQRWKDEEEKHYDEEIEKLKLEYKRNLDFAHMQCDEKLRKKDDELRRKEEVLKEENRLEFEKRHLELERAWSEIEASKKDLRIEKEHFEAAKKNFALRMSNDNLLLQRQKDELVKEANLLKEREKDLNEKIRNEVMEAKQKERDWIVGKVKEWNIKEAKLIEKCEALHEKIRQSSNLQSTINEQASTIRVLQADISSLGERLSDSEARLEQAQRKLREYSDYQALEEENKRLKEELLSKSKDNLLAMKETELANVQKRLKLVEETADLRIKELKLRLKVCSDHLHETVNACRNHHLIGSTKSLENKQRTTMCSLTKARQSSPLPTESNTSPSGNSSSFDRNLKDRLKNIDELSRKLDVSVAEYRSRQFKGDVTPVSHQQLDFVGQNGNYSAPQPLMTSTPKLQRRTTCSIGPEVSKNDKVNFNEQPNSFIGSNSLRRLRRASFGGNVGNGKESSRRVLSFCRQPVKHFQNKLSDSSGEDADSLIRRYVNIAKERKRATESCDQVHEAKSSSQSNDSVVEEGGTLGVDLIEEQDGGNDSEW